VLSKDNNLTLKAMNDKMFKQLTEIHDF